MSKLKKSLNKYHNPLVVAAIFAVIGSVTLIFTQAAGPHFDFEAEGNGVGVISPAAIGSDTTASDGHFVWFGTETPPGNQGIFTESFGNLSHWSFSHWNVSIPGSSNPGSTATIVNNAALIRTAEQNYGDATLRSDRLYDLRNGGTVAFDVSLGDGALVGTGAFIGYPFVAFVDQPLNAPSYFDDNGRGTGPRNGAYYQFWHTCSIMWQAGHARQFVNYVETVRPGEENCLGQVSMAEGQLNRVELRYNGNDGWELWASNASTTAPLTRLRSFNMQIPEVGYFLLGSHNHASNKYSNPENSRPTANATYDNVSYPAAGYTSTYLGGANVTKGAATLAHVSFNGYAPPASTSYSVTINGVTVPITPSLRESRSFPASVEVPLSAVRDGANTITTQGFTNVANLDLVLTRNTP